MPSPRVLKALGVALLAWIVVTVASEPWPSGPTHDVRITRFGSLVMPMAHDADPTPPPSVKPMLASSGRCEVNISMGTENQIRPGSLILLTGIRNGPPTVAAEVLLARNDSSDARLLGAWTDCPPLYDAIRGPCSRVADVAFRSRPTRVGPEEAKVWDRDLADLAARPECKGWTPPEPRPPIPGVDGYEDAGGY